MTQERYTADFFKDLDPETPDEEAQQRADTWNRQGGVSYEDMREAVVEERVTREDSAADAIKDQQ